MPSNETIQPASVATWPPYAAFRFRARNVGSMQCGWRRHAMFLLFCAVLLLLISYAKAADVETWSGPPAMPNLPESSIWSGAYAGVAIGFSQTFTEAKSGGDKKPLTGSGPAVSLYGGYNWQISRVILGVEGSATFLGGGAKATHGTLGLIKSRSNWSATAKGRIGVPIGRFMPYLSAGLAATDNTFKANGKSDKAVGVSAVFGGGLEFAAQDNWRLRADYSLSGILDKKSSFSGTSAERAVGNHRFMLGMARTL